MKACTSFVVASDDRLLDRSQLTQLEKAGPAECSNMISHGELTVEQNAKVVNDT